MVFQPAQDRNQLFSVCGVGDQAVHTQPERIMMHGHQVAGAEVLANSGIIVAEEIGQVLATLGGS